MMHKTLLKLTFNKIIFIYNKHENNKVVKQR